MGNQMSAIEVRNFGKNFGNQAAVRDLSFRVEPGEILVVVGASGCGKTTTLRCIAGLEKPSSGTIVVQGRVVASDKIFIPPEQRGIGMMFQSYALWPHMTVYENISYGLLLRRDDAATVKAKVARAVSLVGLEGLEHRHPNELSGGQQQRVALARSIVTEPSTLLLDEPLSNLDAKMREQMRTDVRRLIKKLGITAVHITHDQTEAMAIADRVIFMRKGRIEQIGTPKELYHAPVSRHVAEFIGSSNFLNGIVKSSDATGCEIDLGHGVTLRSTHGSRRPDVADKILVALRPEALTLTATKPDGANVFSGKIVEETFLGEHAEYQIATGPVTLLARSKSSFAAGISVFVSVEPEHVMCLPNISAETSKIEVAA